MTQTARETTPAPGPTRAQGPSGLEAIRFLRRIQGPEIIGAIEELWRRYGDTAIVPLPFGRSLHFVNNPADVMEILVRQAKKFAKGKALEVFRILMGDGVATADQPLWAGYRRIVQPSFHTRVLHRYVPTALTAFEEHRRAWLSAADGLVDVNHLLPQLAQDIIARTLLGADLSRELAKLHTVWDDAMAFVVRRTNAALPLPLAWPLPSHRRFEEARQLIRASVAQLVQRQIDGEAGDPDSFVTRLLATSEGRGLGRDEIVVHILNILFAGHETTGNCLASCLYFILRDPAIKTRILAEIDGTLGPEPPDYASLERLWYLRQTVHEALRIYPPVSVFVREALEAVTLSTGPLKAGAIILLSPYILHRHPDLWSDPERFDPERFTSVELMGPPHLFAFGAGGRTCLGDQYAVNAMMLLLTRMFQTLSMELDAETPVGTGFNGTLRPDPLHLHIRARAPT